MRSDHNGKLELLLVPPEVSDDKSLASIVKSRMMFIRSAINSRRIGLFGEVTSMLLEDVGKAELIVEDTPHNSIATSPQSLLAWGDLTTTWLENRDLFNVCHEQLQKDRIQNAINRLRSDVLERWKSRSPSSHAVYTDRSHTSASGIDQQEVLLPAIATSAHPAMTFLFQLAWASLWPFVSTVGEPSEHPLGTYSCENTIESLNYDCFEAFFEAIKVEPSEQSLKRFIIKAGLASLDRVHVNEENKTLIIAASHFDRARTLLQLLLPREWMLLPGCYLEEDVNADMSRVSRDFEFGLLL